MGKMKNFGDPEISLIDIYLKVFFFFYHMYPNLSKKIVPATFIL